MTLFKSVVLSTAMALAASPLYATSVLTGDVWEVDAIDTANIDWDGSTLVFTSQTAVTGGNFSVAGYFDWTSNIGAGGREYFSGLYFADDTFDFSGTQLENPNGIVLARYRGTVSADGTVIDGDWDDGVPGDFIATRQTPAVPLPAGLPLIGSALLALGLMRRLRSSM